MNPQSAVARSHSEKWFSVWVWTALDIFNTCVFPPMGWRNDTWLAQWSQHAPVRVSITYTPRAPCTVGDMCSETEEREAPRTKRLRRQLLELKDTMSGLWIDNSCYLFIPPFPRTHAYITKTVGEELCDCIAALPRARWDDLDPHLAPAVFTLHNPWSS